MGKALHEWNMQNQGAVLAFDMPNRMKIEAFNDNSTYDLRKSFLQGPQFGLYNPVSWTQLRQER